MLRHGKVRAVASVHRVNTDITFRLLAIRDVPLCNWV